LAAVTAAHAGDLTGVRGNTDTPEEKGVLGMVGEDACAGGEGEGEGGQLGGFEAEALGVEEEEQSG
jgi:hypothetical protein